MYHIFFIHSSVDQHLGCLGSFHVLAIVNSATVNIGVHVSFKIMALREFQKNIYCCFIDYAKSFDCVNHHKLWKILKEMEYQTTWPASWEICMQVRNQQLELHMEQQTGSK